LPNLTSHVNSSSYPITAASVAVFEGGRFLLIKRKYPPLKGWLSFPGGKVEHGESPIEAAARELYEETALTAEKLKLIITIDLQSQDEATKPTLLNVYQAFGISGEPIAGDDASTIGWYDIKEMHQAQVIPSVLNVANNLVQTEYSERT